MTPQQYLIAAACLAAVGLLFLVVGAWLIVEAKYYYRKQEVIYQQILELITILEIGYGITRHMDRAVQSLMGGDDEDGPTTAPRQDRGPGVSESRGRGD